MDGCVEVRHRGRLTLANKFLYMRIIYIKRCLLQNGIMTISMILWLMVRKSKYTFNRALVPEAHWLPLIFRSMNTLAVALALLGQKIATLMKISMAEGACASLGSARADRGRRGVVVRLGRGAADLGRGAVDLGRGAALKNKI
jgi:hypothetical protein